MANVKATKLGYYDHRRVRPGEVFDMAEVDEQGFYLNGSGEKLKDSKGKQKKCLWVVPVDAAVAIQVDPREIAKVISGKSPGKKRQEAR